MTHAFQYQAVLDYWFGQDLVPSEENRNRWFSGGPSVDDEIRAQFSELHEQLTQGRCAVALDDPDQLLAAILVIDQFSRNLFRKSAVAFSWDDQAIAWSMDGWAQHLFSSQPSIQQAFSILPLVHSEQIELHDRAISLLKNLISTAAETDTMLTAFYSSATEHRAIIQQFGRYPHRNEILGRQPTDKETEYLNSGGSRFGQ